MDAAAYVVAGAPLGDFCPRYLAKLEAGDFDSDGDGEQQWQLEVDVKEPKTHEEDPHD